MLLTVRHEKKVFKTQEDGLTCIPFWSDGFTGTLGILRSSKTSGSIVMVAGVEAGASLKMETASWTCAGNVDERVCESEEKILKIGINVAQPPY